MTCLPARPACTRARARRRPACASRRTCPAMVSALKPRGNPLAAGRRGPPRREAGSRPGCATCRGRSPAAARLSLFTGITAAQPVSLVEDAWARAPGRRCGAGAPLPVAADRAGWWCRPPGPSRWGSPSQPATPAPPGPRRRPRPRPCAAARPPPEPAQPVFTRYWLHGKGPAPAGNLPVAVHLSPGRIAFPSVAGAPGPGPRSASPWPAGRSRRGGVVELDVPPGLTATPAGPLRYDLPALGHAHWDLAVRGAAGAPPGTISWPRGSPTRSARCWRTPWR